MIDRQIVGTGAHTCPLLHKAAIRTLKGKEQKVSLLGVSCHGVKRKPLACSRKNAKLLVKKQGAMRGRGMRVNDEGYDAYGLWDDVGIVPYYSSVNEVLYSITYNFLFNSNHTYLSFTVYRMFIVCLLLFNNSVLY